MTDSAGQQNLMLARLISGSWEPRAKFKEDLRHPRSAHGFDQALDTLGYIQLQLGQNKDAVHTFSRMNSNNPSLTPAVFYRFGVALSRVGRNSEAQRYFDRAKQQGFEPTHELLLVPVKAST